MTRTETLYRRDGPETSAEAAESIDATRLESIVLELVAKHGAGGATQDDILSLLTSLAYSSVTARFAALKRKGLTEVVGKRAGKSGRDQSIHVATKLGRAFVK